MPESNIISSRLPKNWKKSDISPEDRKMFLSKLTDKSTSEGQWISEMRGRIQKDNLNSKITAEDVANWQLDGEDYDLAKAMKSGLTPSRNPHDGTFHWGSTTQKGEWLKSPDHPSAWMQVFGQITGEDPQDIGINDSKKAEQYLQQWLKNNKSKEEQ